jgi:hypothetical protein
MQVCASLTKTMLDKGIVAHRTATIHTGYSELAVSILYHTELGAADWHSDRD